jgi:hypothetical protein
MPGADPPAAIDDKSNAATLMEQLLAPALKYFQVGMNQAASQAIERLPAGVRASREVLTLRAFIYEETGAWQLLCDVAGVLVREWPGDAQHWIWHAAGTRHRHGLAEAGRVLHGALHRHDSEPMIHFGLACVAAQAGMLEVAREHLTRASGLDPHCHRLAWDTPDLAPLWASLGKPPPTSGT